MDNLQQLLIHGLQQLNLSIAPDKVEKLLRFIELIAKWNKAYNLTAVHNPQEMVTLHLLDSLAILPYLRGESILDVGTGAGLPGIPLAIYQPETQFILLDSNAKKTRFVQQVILELRLSNVQILHQRIEDLTGFKNLSGLSVDTVITRAFASMNEIVRLTYPLLKTNGVLLAMKGQPDANELAELTQSYQIIHLTVPYIEAARCLVCVDKSI